MVPIMSLLLPIVVSSVFVFIVSSVIHMVLGYHSNDLKKLPNENAMIDAMKALNLPDGTYAFPKPDNMKDMGTPEFKEKVKKGPNGIVTIWHGDSAGMGKALALWFVYSLVVGVFAAYVAGRALQPGAHYLEVFRFAGVTAFCCYAIAHWQQSIWWKQSWTVTLKNTIDALLFACVTAGTFGWLWPR